MSLGGIDSVAGRVLPVRVQFTGDEQAEVSDEAQVAFGRAADMLQIDEDALETVLVSRRLEVGGKVMRPPHTPTQVRLVFASPAHLRVCWVTPSAVFCCCIARLRLCIVALPM